MSVQTNTRKIGAFANRVISTLLFLSMLFVWLRFLFDNGPRTFADASLWTVFCVLVLGVIALVEKLVG